MLSQLDEIMAQCGVDAIIAYAFDGMQSPLFQYLTGAQLSNGGWYISAADSEPVILAESSFEMPTFQKKSTIRDVRSLATIVKQNDAPSACLVRILNECGVRKQSKIIAYDPLPLRQFVGLAALGYTILPVNDKIDVVGEIRQSKSEQELEFMKLNSLVAQKVLEKTMALLAECKIRNNRLIRNNNYLTIGDTKQLINNYCIQLGLSSSNNLIISQGAESAEPHNTGTDSFHLRTNTPTIIDFYPQNLENRYWHDMARTIVFGKASKQVKEIHEVVINIQETVQDMMCAGALWWQPFAIASRLFKNKGFNVSQNGHNNSGFVHDLGHGIGVQLHEQPYISKKKHTGNRTFKINSVFTNEPGLYFPGRFGIRVEDVLISAKSGTTNLTTFSKELEW